MFPAAENSAPPSESFCGMLGRTQFIRCSIVGSSPEMSGTSSGKVNKATHVRVVFILAEVSVQAMLKTRPKPRPKRKAKSAEEENEAEPPQKRAKTVVGEILRRDLGMMPKQILGLHSF